MQSTTLRGIFPERKISHRKNFIKENVRRIKQIQDYSSQFDPENIVPKLSSSHRLAENDSKNMNKIMSRRPGIQKLEIKPIIKKLASPRVEKMEEKIIHRSMQTEPSDNIDTIYSTGVIKYPSPPVLNTLQKNRKPSSKKKDHSHGDSRSNAEDVYAKENKTDYIKQNMQIKGKNPKKDTHDPTKVPSTYKKGVVPKYIKQKKEAPLEDTADIDCPSGHVLLPEEERKETLKVLRESYAEKIQELNSMPVRSDTLKMQKRKLELEDELKKIDEGIKVFQRPKVFVRICV